LINGNIFYFALPMPIKQLSLLISVSADTISNQTNCIAQNVISYGKKTAPPNNTGGQRKKQDFNNALKTKHFL